ncbi:MAG TPA: aminodeoxychorismate synthase component I [Solirubrobacterales bacterium]|jgi:para-aminobenzoate synthetase|nr:aminodeoxychorismate synthase component I [Solirubrobacterales bacterium]
MLTLLIDNYDSFTYNLFQLLAKVNGREPLVVRNDEASWEELERLEFDNVVISPGPGRPDRARDFGFCAEAIRRCEKPLLGVCLGMQGLGWVEGGTVQRAPQPLHGRVVAVEHDGSPLFAGIPSPFQATRYHSLALATPLPTALRETATCAGVPMALEHRDRPQWGAQFHPESIATEHGRRLLANFRDLTGLAGGGVPTPDTSRYGSMLSVWSRDPAPRDRAALELRVESLEAFPDPEAAFVALHGDSEHAYWLDSSRPGERGRFSFMGDASGPLSEVIEHRAGEGKPLLDRLQERLDQLRPTKLPDLPFEFDCGFVGYLGYELKSECGYRSLHSSPHPDAALIFSDRLVVFDHDEKKSYLLCLHKHGEEEVAGAWLSTTSAKLEALSDGGSGESRRTLPAVVRRDSPDPPTTARSKSRYLADIETCLQHLRNGDSYELCLTNQIQLDLDIDPLDLYLRLRRANPAPFSAYLRLGDLTVLSSSPERFLRVTREGEAEARPIKGTSRRGATAEEDARLAAALAADEKNRAENLMIVDLLRNDLGQVCAVGSVEVPEMMAVETYETVHQLVSSVRGRLRPGASAADAVRSCFPPGSMTGAPKRRTTEILDALEGAPRGVYSGAIGWFGLGGAADLAVAIRTIVLAGGHATVGAGGAIVLDSDPEREYEEMLLKAAAPLRAVDPEFDPASISLALQSAAATALPR